LHEARRAAGDKVRAVQLGSIRRKARQEDTIVLSCH